MKNHRTILLSLLFLVSLTLSVIQIKTLRIQKVYVLDQDTLISQFSGTLEVKKLLDITANQLQILSDSANRFEESLIYQNEDPSENAHFLSLVQEIESISNKLLQEREYHAVWITQQINEGINSYASDSKIDIIISGGGMSGFIQYAKSKYDVTEEIIQYLNNNYQYENN